MFLTKRQKELYDYLQSYIRRHGYAPTFQEIGKHFKLSSLATVHKHLSNLESKGLIKRHWNYSRAIELIDSGGPRVTELPLLGRVAAGQPIEAIETDDTLTVPEAYLGRGRTYALLVKGDSMIQDGILDGDHIIVEERADADNGQTVVALVDGAATVKRFHREGPGLIRLQPANDGIPPIRVKDTDVEIRGVVVAVLRKY